MKKILETERVFLREMTQEDFFNISLILQDAETMRAYEHAFSGQEVQDWLDRQIRRYEHDGFGLWGVVLKQDRTFIGQIGLTVQETPRGPETEIGWLLNRAYWHQGYAVEAAEGCKRYAFDVLGKKKTVSIIRDTNTASRRVAERVGMMPEFSFVKHYYGVDMPHIVYAVTNP